MGDCAFGGTHATCYDPLPLSLFLAPSHDLAMLISSVFWVHQDKQGFGTLPQKAGELDPDLLSFFCRSSGMGNFPWL